MPPSIEQALPMMLRGSLLSYAVVRNFNIEDDAANFFVNRAFENISRGGPNAHQLYGRALIATSNLPRFFDRIEPYSQARQFVSALAAQQVIQRVQNSEFGSIYPWCTDVDTP